MEQRHGHVLRKRSNVQAVGINFLRAIVGETRRDGNGNTYIRVELRMQEIQNKNLEK